MKHAFHRFDAAATKWISTTFGQNARRFFLIMTAFGDPITVGLIAGLIFIYGLLSANMSVVYGAIAIPLTVLVGAFLKLLFERARPTTEYALNMKLQTFSFPSGHSSGSTVTYGTISLLLLSVNQPLLVTVAITFLLIPILVGISRVYLGAHFPTDVVAGWSLGALSLILLILYVKPVIMV